MFSFSFISVHILISFLISSVIFLVIHQCVVQPPYVGIFNSFCPVKRVFKTSSILTHSQNISNGYTEMKAKIRNL